METKKKLRESIRRFKRRIRRLEDRNSSWQGSFDTLFDFMWMVHRMMHEMGLEVCDNCRGKGRYTIIRGRNEPGKGQDCRDCEGKGFVKLELDEPVKFNIIPKEE